MADDVEPQTDELDNAEGGLADNPSYCMKAVRIFMAGSYEKTKTNPETGEDEVVVLNYTDSDLQEMVDNFDTFCTGQNMVYETPVVVGHEQNQDILDITGLPAAGWIRKLWIEQQQVDTPVLPIDGLRIQRRTLGSKQTFLMAFIGGMPQLAAQWVKDGKYRYCSAEITEPGATIPGVPAKGRFLLRLAILGATPPHVKALGPLPTPTLEGIGQFSQTPGNVQRIGFWLPSGSLVCFSEERRAMNETLKKSLMEQGVPEDQATQMASMDSKCYASVSKAFADAGGSAPAPASGGFDRAAAIEKLATLPDSDRDALSKMTDEELQAMLAKNGFADSHMENGGPTTSAGDAGVASGVAGTVKSGTNTGSYSDDTAKADKDKVDKNSQAHFAQAQKILDEAKQLSNSTKKELAVHTALLSADNKIRAERIRKAKHAEVATFCDGLVKDQKVLPSEIDSVKQMLLLAADQPEATVVTFSQGGKAEKMHPLEMLKKQFTDRKKLPIAFFSQSGALPAGPKVDEANSSRAKSMLGTSMLGREIAAKKK